MDIQAKGKYIFLKQTKSTLVDLKTQQGLYVPDGCTLPKGIDPSRTAEIVSVGDDPEVDAYRSLIGRQVFATGTCPIMVDEDAHRYLYCYKENIVGILPAESKA